MAGPEGMSADSFTVDVDNLYREESITDLRAATIRRLIPIKADGSDDALRPSRFIGDTTLMTQMGPIPVQFPLDAPTLAEGEKNRRQRELVEQDRDLQRERREFQEDLNQRKNEELSGVVERANRVIKQIFEQEKYDLILQEVIFAGPRVDITEKVIKALNAAGPAK